MSPRKPSGLRPGERGRIVAEAWRAFAAAREDLIDAEEELAAAKRRVELGNDADAPGELAEALQQHANAGFQVQEALGHLRDLGEPLPPEDRETPASAAEPKFVILCADRRESGIALWWGKKRFLRTTDLDSAGHYTREEYAEAVPQAHRRHNVPVPVDEARRAARPTVLFHDLNAALAAQGGTALAAPRDAPQEHCPDDCACRDEARHQLARSPGDYL